MAFESSNGLTLLANTSNLMHSVNNNTGSGHETPSEMPNSEGSTITSTLPQDTFQIKNEKQLKSGIDSKRSLSAESGPLSKMSLSVGSIIDQSNAKSGHVVPDQENKKAEGASDSSKDSEASIGFLNPGSSRIDIHQTQDDSEDTRIMSKSQTRGNSSISRPYESLKALDGNSFDSEPQNRKAHDDTIKQPRKDQASASEEKNMREPEFNPEDLLFNDATNDLADGISVHVTLPTDRLKSQNDNVRDKRKHLGLNESQQSADNKVLKTSTLKKQPSSELISSGTKSNPRPMHYESRMRKDLCTGENYDRGSSLVNMHNSLSGQSFESNSIIANAIENANKETNQRRASEITSEENNLSNLGEIGTIPELSHDNDVRATILATDKELKLESKGENLDAPIKNDLDANSNAIKPRDVNKRIELEESIRRQNRPGRKFGAKKKLWVWSWFVQDQNDPNVAVCDFCGKVVRRRPSDKGSPKKLNEHLRTHKLNKTLVNTARVIPLESIHSSYGAQPLQLLFNDIGSSLVLTPQQIHQVPIQAQPTHNLVQQEYHNHSVHNTQSFATQGSDRERLSQEYTQGLSMAYSNNAQLKSQGQQNYNMSQIHPNMPRQPNSTHQLQQGYSQNHQAQRTFASHQAHAGHPVQQQPHYQNTQHQHQSQPNYSVHSNYPSIHTPQKQADNPNSRSSQRPQGSEAISQTPSNHPNFQNHPLNAATPRIMQTHSHYMKENSNSNFTKQEPMSSDHNPISPELTQQSKDRWQSSSHGNERKNLAHLDRQLETRRSDRSEDLVENRVVSEDSFDESPYSETKLLRHILAFLHENKLPIDVVKLPSFRQLIYDLRPDSVKDLLVIDTVYSSCVEVARTSSNPPLSTDSVFPSSSAIDKVDPSVLKR